MPVIRQSTTRVMLNARLASALFWTVTALWLLVLSLWISLHVLIVPRIDQFRPWLQEHATRVLGVTVELGPLTASSKGWVPEFEVNDIRLLGLNGHPLLNLGRLTLRLTPASALQGEFSQITLERLSVDVQRDAQGTFHLGDMPLGRGQDQQLRDWVFEQWEWVLRDGDVHFIDQEGGQHHFSGLEMVLQNGLRHHQFRIDATPPSALGARFSLRGEFKQALLNPHAGQFETWSGQLYAATGQVDLAAWQRFVAPQQPVNVMGQGWTRGWWAVRDGQLKSWTQDFQLNQVQWSQASEWAGLLPDLRHAQGRLEWVNGSTQHLSLKNAKFEPENEPAWPLSQADFEWQTQAGAMTLGQLNLDALDLAQLSHWDAQMPSAWLAWLRQANPRGLAQNIKLKWTGSRRDLNIEQWSVKLKDISWQAAPSRKDAGLANWPGASSVSGELSGTGTSIQGVVTQSEGHWQWPGLWDEPIQKVDRLQVDFQAQTSATQTHLKINRAQLQAGSTRADLDLDWTQTPQDPLGRMQLHVQVPEVAITQITSWLPQSLPAPVRQYLKEALPQGTAQSVTAQMSGRLADFPFTQKGSGQFRISGLVRGVKFNTVPKSLQPSSETGEWPVLQDLSGELVFDRASVKLSRIKTRVAQAPGMVWSDLEAHIAQLDKAVVSVRAAGKGPLNDALQYWRVSPLNGYTDRALDSAQAQGGVDLRMNLVIPIDKPEATQANGWVTFSGNDISLGQVGPNLNRVRGGLRFTANGFELNNVQALLWGGETRIEGGAKADAGTSQPKVWLKLQGQINARGLQEAPELSAWSAPLKTLTGSANYSARIQWRQGQIETQFNSSMVGMAVRAPSGLGKNAAQSMPLHFENSLNEVRLNSSQSLQDQVNLRWGDLDARLIRDVSGDKPRVTRGLIRWGPQTTQAMPEQGVLVHVNADQLELDPWSEWLQKASGSPSDAIQSMQTMPAVKITLQAQSVGLAGRHVHQVTLDAGNQGLLWSGHIRSQELEGDLSYQLPNGAANALLKARLSRLSIPPQAKVEVDALLDQNAPDFPTLDLEVKDLDLHGKKLGSLVLQAQNQITTGQAREWRLSKLMLSNEDGAFNAQGLWQKSPTSSRSQTRFDFKLTLKNAGNMLNRMGTPDAVRAGSGFIEGEVRWQGTPISPDTSSMSGQFRIQVERGQFLKTEPGAARLLGVLNLQALPRRLLLDFRDVFSEGFAFDLFRGDVVIDHGVAQSQNLQMKGVSAVVMMDGQADIVHETQHLKVLVIPDINAAGASLLYSAINPVVGLTTFIAQYVLRRPLTDSNTQQFEIEGTWDEPKVTQVPFKTEAQP